MRLIDWEKHKEDRGSSPGLQETQGSRSALHRSSRQHRNLECAWKTLGRATAEDNNTLALIGRRSLNRWPDDNCQQVHLPTAPAVGNQTPVWPLQKNNTTLDPNSFFPVKSEWRSETLRALPHCPFFTLWHWLIVRHLCLCEFVWGMYECVWLCV